MNRETRKVYESLDKIDGHLHLNTPRNDLQQEGVSEQFSLVTINTEVPFFPSPDKQLEIATACRDAEPGRLGFIATFDTATWGEKGWQEQAIEQIRDGIENGASAVKIWKNFGMELRDRDGSFVMINHPSLEPVLNYLEENAIPLLAHLGEPKNCWLPLEEMTVTSDREYFAGHPQYHMYLHKEYPSYREQLAARDRMLARHPGLRFVGAHLASLEWSVDQVADWLDRHPLCGVDLAERVCHLQHQAIDRHDKVKEFVETYRDRIIYGTDQIDDGSLTGDELRRQIRTKWHSEFQFFAEDSLQTAWNVEKPFRGLGLSENVLHKLFRENAITYYPKLEGHL